MLLSTEELAELADRQFGLPWSWSMHDGSEYEATTLLDKEGGVRASAACRNYGYVRQSEYIDFHDTDVRDYITAACNAVPELLAEIKRLEDRIQQYENSGRV